MAMKRQGRSSSTIDVVRKVSQHRANTICMGSDNAGAPKVEISSTSRPLANFIQPSTLRTYTKYDWKTGEHREERASVVANAVEQINTHKIKTVTSNRRDCKQKEKEYNYGTSIAPATTRGY